MLSEYENLVPTEKEMELRVFINQLTNNLYSNEKIEVDSKKLLELLDYLTSNENISTPMKTALEYQNSIITDILHKKEVEHLKKYIKYLKENSIPVQKVKDKIEELKKEYEIALEENSTKAFILKCKISALEELLEDK